MASCAPLSHPGDDDDDDDDDLSSTRTMHNEQANFPSDFDLSGFLAQPQTSVNNGGANNIAGSSSGGHEAGSSQLDLQLDNNQRARRPLQHLQARPDSLMSSVEQRSEDRPMMGLQQQTVPNAGNQVNLDALQQLLSMQMDSSNAQMQLQQHQHQQHGGPPNTMATSAQSLLEQQVRLNQLQQLQQLQNQIFQQQARQPVHHHVCDCHSHLRHSCID